jgi:hypothetical protein
VTEWWGRVRRGTCPGGYKRGAAGIEGDNNADRYTPTWLQRVGVLGRDRHAQISLGER